MPASTPLEALRALTRTIDQLPKALAQILAEERVRRRSEQQQAQQPEEHPARGTSAEAEEPAPRPSRRRQEEASYPGMPPDQPYLFASLRRSWQEQEQERGRPIVRPTVRGGLWKVGEHLPFVAPVLKQVEAVHGWLEGLREGFAEIGSALSRRRGPSAAELARLDRPEFVRSGKEMEARRAALARGGIGSGARILHAQRTPPPPPLPRMQGPPRPHVPVAPRPHGLGAMARPFTPPKVTQLIGRARPTQLQPPPALRKLTQLAPSPQRKVTQTAPAGTRPLPLTTPPPMPRMPPALRAPSLPPAPPLRAPSLPRESAPAVPVAPRERRTMLQPASTDNPVSFEFYMDEAGKDRVRPILPRTMMAPRGTQPLMMPGGSRISRLAGGDRGRAVEDLGEKLDKLAENVKTLTETLKGQGEKGEGAAPGISEGATPAASAAVAHTPAPVSPNRKDGPGLEFSRNTGRAFH